MFPQNQGRTSHKMRERLLSKWGNTFPQYMGKTHSKEIFLFDDIFLLQRLFDLFLYPFNDISQDFRIDCFFQLPVFSQCSFFASLKQMI